MYIFCNFAQNIDFETVLKNRSTLCMYVCILRSLVSIFIELTFGAPAFVDGFKRQTLASSRLKAAHPYNINSIIKYM